MLSDVGAFALLALIALVPDPVLQRFLYWLVDYRRY